MYIVLHSLYNDTKQAFFNELHSLNVVQQKKIIDQYIHSFCSKGTNGKGEHEIMKKTLYCKLLPISPIFLHSFLDFEKNVPLALRKVYENNKKSFRTHSLHDI